MSEPAVFIQREILDILLKDKMSTGAVMSGLLKKPFGNPVPLYEHPAAADQAKIAALTEALRKLIKAVEQDAELEGYDPRDIVDASTGVALAMAAADAALSTTQNGGA